jgi:hypothetical protein
MTEITATITQEDLTTASTTLSNPPILETMAQIGDVDLENLKNGSILVYKGSNSKWTSTTNLDAQTMEGGFF